MKQFLVLIYVWVAAGATIGDIDFVARHCPEKGAWPLSIVRGVIWPILAGGRLTDLDWDSCLANPMSSAQ